MADQPSLHDLLSRWERERTPAEELCRACPELLEPLRQKIRALREMEIALHSNPDDTPNLSQAAESSRPDSAETPPARQVQPPGTAEPPAVVRTEDYRAPAVTDQPVAQPTSGAAMLGRYRLVRQLGRGGFGEVWEAFDPDLDRAVAVKRPRPDRRLSEEERGLFLREARKVASLRHPHIVPVYDVGRHEDTCFIVSEYMDGASLADEMARGRPSFERSARLVADLAEALHHAHLCDVVHRDVKPGNILLDRQGRAYLADFGLAVSEDEQLYEQRGLLGTVSYMSPEQARGDSHLVDARSDIYSLGVVLYELLTGRLPYKAPDPVQYRDQVLHRPPRPPRTIDDAIPARLERICLKCLAKSVEHRYTTASDLARDLRIWFDRQNHVAVPIPKRNHRRRSFVVVLALMLAVGLGTWAGLTYFPLTRVLDSSSGDDPTTPLPGDNSPNGVKPDAAAVKVRKLIVRDWIGHAQWGILENDRILVDVEDHGILGLGSTDSGDLELAALIKHDGSWNGGVGLVFGHRQEPVGLKTRHSYQAVRINKVGKKYFVEHVHEKTEIAPRDYPHPVTRQISFKMLEGWTRNEFTLSIRIHQGRLAEVKVEGQAIEMDDGPFHALLDTLDAAGDFGLYHREGVSTFSDIRVNNQKLTYFVKG